MRMKERADKTIISMLASSQQIIFLILRTADILSAQFSENQNQKLSLITGLVVVSVL